MAGRPKNRQSDASEQAKCRKPIAVVQIKAVASVELDIGNQDVAWSPFPLLKNSPAAVNRGEKPVVARNNNRLSNFDRREAAEAKVNVNLPEAPNPPVFRNVHQHVGLFALIAQLEHLPADQ